jgi:penicillin-binding protein 2
MSERSRLRLVVLELLALSLMVTLFTRLWYVQVVGGEAYQAQAQDNAVRQVILPPPRGLIVDDMGRPLAATRTAWVVTVDRTVVDNLAPARAEALLRRVGRTVDLSYADVLARTKLCGEAGAEPPPVCWNGSPYQPVTVAADVSQQQALAIQERSEDFPGVRAEARKVRAYPAPFGVNAAHVLGYLSPITAGELERVERRGDAVVDPSSLVGRSGVESEYDRYLRGVPGERDVAVDSMGRVRGDAGVTPPQPGYSLVTSIDAKVQAVVERQLHRTIRTARQTHDPVTGRNYRADSGAVVVMDASNGRLVAMASYPTYNPDVWVGGISSADLDRLYSTEAGTPLLSRATQGQLAPGSTFKPITAAAALTHGYTTRDELDCSSSYLVGDRVFNNYESAAYGYLTFAEALQLSCDTFFYRVAYQKWLAAGGDSGDVHTKDPIVATAKEFGLGRTTGVDLPGEASGRIADRRWKKQYWLANKDYYCKVAKQSGQDYLHVFAREFCPDGWRYRAGDAVNFAIGQGDTMLTPIQLAVVYGALANGGTLWEPRVGKAVVDGQGEVVHRVRPQRAGRVDIPDRVLRYIDRALLGTTKVGTIAWRFVGFPLEEVKVRSKTGTAEVFGKQTTSWVASYDKRYVVVMMVAQAGTGSGTSGPAVRKIWETLYGVHGERVDLADAALPAAKPPAGLPVFAADGSITPPVGPSRQPGGR